MAIKHEKFPHLFSRYIDRKKLHFSLTQKNIQN